MPELKEASVERVDSLEKFKAWLKAHTEDNTDEGNWGMEDGKYLKLFNGPPNEENFWLWRELGRRELDPEDERVHFDQEKWLHFDHFCRVSSAAQDLMSYFPDAEKGKRDIRINVKVGRYLKKYYGENLLTEDQIRELANKHREKWAEQQLHFATTEEDIVEVYTYGPKSCVGGLTDEGGTKYKDDKFFVSGIHPVRVYASPDLAVAYMKRDGKPTARALCNVVKKEYVRLYGDTVLAGKLEREGFKLSGTALLGATMRKILKDMPDGKHVVAPYFDGDSHAFNVYEDHIKVETGGAYQGTQAGTCKLIAMITCAHHPHEAREDQAMHTPEGLVCKTCIASFYTTAMVPEGSGYENRYVRNDNIVVSKFTGSRFDKTADWSGTSFGMVAGHLAQKADIVTTISGAEAHRTQVFPCGYDEDGDTTKYASLSDLALDWTIYARKEDALPRQAQWPAAPKRLKKLSSSTHASLLLGDWIIGYCEENGWPGLKGGFPDSVARAFSHLVPRPFSSADDKAHLRSLFLKVRDQRFASGEQHEEVPQQAA